MLDLGSVQSAADKLARVGLCKSPDGALYQWSTELAVNVPNGVLIVGVYRGLAGGGQSDELRGRGLDGAAESLELARLYRWSVIWLALSLLMVLLIFLTAKSPSSSSTDLEGR